MRQCTPRAGARLALVVLAVLSGCGSRERPADARQSGTVGKGATVKSANPKAGNGGAAGNEEKVGKAEVAHHKELTLDLGGGVKLELVLIPAGKFLMGSPEKDRVSDETQHEVTISKAFYMGKYEVTQDQYEVMRGNNPSEFKGAKNPVEKVSWDDATEFCKKLGAKSGRTVRLPTEAEWEYACRAGTKTRFSFGDDDGELWKYGNYCDASCTFAVSEKDKGHSDGHDRTAPVGSYRPNGWGLYDMHGNVFEFCQDWYGSYDGGAAVDPKGPDQGTGRVVRGGSWVHLAWSCCSALRTWVTPDYRDYIVVGFRVVVDPK